VLWDTLREGSLATTGVRSSWVTGSWCTLRQWSVEMTPPRLVGSLSLGDGHLRRVLAEQPSLS
jgi:hypothetical protein